MAQKEIEVAIFQGESQFVDDNIALGELTVPIPSGPKGAQAIEVRFTYDPSGLLEVETASVATGVRRRLVIEGNPGVLSADEIASRLKALESLKIHPRDQAENQALLARGKRLYEERLGYDRDEIGAVLVGFVAAMEEQDPERLRQARQALEETFARFDSDQFI